MKINVKTRIKYKGEEYSSVEKLPSEARSAYEKAMAGGGGTSVSSKIVFNGQEYASVDQMPESERHLYEDALRLTRDSSTVALEPKKGSTALLTNGQWQLVLLFAALVLVALIVLFACDSVSGQKTI